MRGREKKHAQQKKWEKQSKKRWADNVKFSLKEHWKERGKVMHSMQNGVLLRRLDQRCKLGKLVSFGRCERMINKEENKDMNNEGHRWPQRLTVGNI